MGLSRDTKCWRCGAVQGTPLHALWDFPVLQPLWDGALHCMEKGLKTNLPRSPRLALLCDQSIVKELGKAKFKILCTGIVAALRIVRKFWKSIIKPTVKEWTY